MINRLNFNTYTAVARNLVSKLLWLSPRPFDFDMREQASKIALLTVASLVASVASALPARPRHKSAPTFEEIRYPLKRHEPRPLRRESASLRREPVPTRETHPIHAAPELELRPEPAHIVVLPEIHVTHNRKIHYSAAPGVSTVASYASTPPLEPSPQPPAAALPSPELAPEALRVVSIRAALAAGQGLKPSSDARPIKTSPSSLKGSKEILLHQNEMADREGLDRIQDEQELHRLRAAKLLVPLPASSALAIDERLPADRRYCRPWTAQFLTALSRAYIQRFHAPLQVNSAVRTVAFQERLRVSNGNAAPAEGQTASPHLTGQAVDLAKHGLSATQIAWLRGYLLPLVQAGKIDVEEEFQQACFHISVYRKYASPATPNRTIQEHHGPGSALAAAVH